MSKLDMSERDRNLLTEQTREANDRMRIMLDEMPICCIFWSTDHTIVDCNESAVKLFGMKSKKEYLEKYYDLMPEYQPSGRTSRDLAVEYIQKAFYEGRIVFNWLYRRLDGVLIPAEVTLVRVRYGNAYIVVEYTRDLREQHKMMREIERQSNLLHKVNKIAAILLQSDVDEFENNLWKCMDMMAESTEADRIYIWKNRMENGEMYCTQLYEWSEKATPAQDTGVATDLPYSAFAVGDYDLEKLLSSGSCVNGIVSNMSPAAKEHLSAQGIMSILIVPLFLHEKFWGFIGLDNCHSNRIFSESEKTILCSAGLLIAHALYKNEVTMNLRAAEKEAKEASIAKSNFLSNMSHEIRTPMNAVIGMTDLLLNEALGGRQMQYVKDIKTSAESLLGIINDVLDLSKISEGRFQMLPICVDLSLLLKNAASMMSFSARTKGLEFIDDIQINSPEYIIIDDVRLNQIIVNLLSNAIKFTKAGHVRLTAKIEGGNIILEVEDTGIGIKKEDLPLIFKAFEQVDRKKNRAVKGTGLGLSITKSLTELMNGKISVASEYGKGTVFKVILPYVQGDEASVEAADTEFNYIFAPMAQVLLVDDIQTNLTVGAGLLRLCGITADVAMSGYEAIELVKSKDYDIVFMDHMMPEMDGVETMETIRKLGGKYRELPIVALTANAVNESRDFLIASGMNDFIPKPIDKGSLMNVLRKWLPEHKIETRSNPVGAAGSAPYSDVLHAAAKIEGLDIELALSRIGGLRDVLESSIKQVSNSLDGQIKKLDSCLSSGDLRGFSAEAHGLKGALANIGATPFSELAAELEIAGKAENTPLCLKKFAVFADVLGGFANALKAIFPNAEPSFKPMGEESFLKEKASNALLYLNNFEASDALAALNDIRKFSFGSETDAVLNAAAAAAEVFNYEKAESLLESILGS